MQTKMKAKAYAKKLRDRVKQLESHLVHESETDELFGEQTDEDS